jgi:hypothetical protein
LAGGFYVILKFYWINVEDTMVNSGEDD